MAAPAPLRVTGISPAVADRGELVTITGGGFGARNLEVTVGGDAVPLVAATGSRASFLVPRLGAVGDVVVVARNPGGITGRIGLRVRFDGNTVAVADEAAAVSEPVGAGGGSIEVEGMTLAIPAGALPEGTEITATPLRSFQGSPFAAAPVGLKLEPSGLVLLQPATLTLPRPAGPGTLVGFGFNENGVGFRLLPHRVVGESVQLKVWHFSGAGTLTARLGELEAALSYEPTPAHELAEQRIAAALVDAQVNGSDPGPAIAFALREWRSSSVLHGLDLARSTTRLDFFELAFGEWLAWLAYLQEYRDSLSAADASFFDTAVREIDRPTAINSAAAVARRQLERCLGPDFPRAAFRNVIRVASAVNLAALPIEETETSGGERPLPNGVNLASACVDVEITAVEHAAALARNRSNLFKVRAQVVFWSGDPSTTIPLRYRLVSASEVTSNGRYNLTIRPIDLGSLELTLTVDLDTAGTDTVLRTIFEQRQLSIPVRERLELHARRATDTSFTDNPGTVTPGSTITLRIRLAGDTIDNQTITLTHDGNGTLPTSATTNPDGEALITYTAPASPGSELVTATITDAGLTTGDALVLTTREPVIVAVTPSFAFVNRGGTVQFTATVTGTSDRRVSWNASFGSISSTGLYTAGASPGIFTITATSLADPSVTTSAFVNVLASSFDGVWTGTYTQADNGGRSSPQPLLGEIRIGPGAFQDGRLHLVATRSLLGNFSLPNCRSTTVSWLLVVNSAGTSFTVTALSCGFPLAAFFPDPAGRTIAGRLDGTAIVITGLYPETSLRIRLTRRP